MTTPAIAIRTTCGFQVLTDPFPLPQVQAVTVPCSSADYGIRMSDHHGQANRCGLPDRVEISGILKDSPFYGTAVREGMQVLAVNLEPATTAARCAINLKAACDQVSVLVSQPFSTPYCRVFAVKLWDSCPGVIFDAAFGRSLVQISHVYSWGPFQGLLEEGDIVIAINGTPISNPEMADRELRNAKVSMFATFHVFNTGALVHSLVKQTVHSCREREPVLWREATLRLDRDDSCVNLSMRGPCSDIRDIIVKSMILDRKAHSMGSPKNTGRFLGSNKNDEKNHARYHRMAEIAAKHYNKLLSEAFKNLKEMVGCAVWRIPATNDHESIAGSTYTRSDDRIATAQVLSLAPSESTTVSEIW